MTAKIHTIPTDFARARELAREVYWTRHMHDRQVLIDAHGILCHGAPEERQMAREIEGMIASPTIRRQIADFVGAAALLLSLVGILWLAYGAGF